MHDRQQLLVNAYCTRRVIPAIPFAHETVVHVERADPSWLSHFHRLMELIVGDEKREMTHQLYAVMRHLERTRHYLRFATDSDAVDALASWAWDANAVLILPDGAVRDPTGLVLVDPQSGTSEPDAVVPFPEEAEQRRGRSDERLRQLGLEPPQVLPPVVGESEVVLRDSESVARRALSLFVVAVRAESVAAGNVLSLSQLRAKSPLAFESLSAFEANFLNSQSPDPQSVIDAAWRYEALFTLQWSLGLHQTLPFADSICDVPLVAKLMLDRDESAFIETATLRPPEEILDVLDFNYRLLWLARQSAHESRPSPLDLDGGVLRERQHALNWLIHFQDAVWDQVDTPT